MQKNVNMTHNLEVLGSSPGWSILKNQALMSFSQVLFSYLRKQCVNKWLESAILTQIILSSFIEYFIHSLSYRKPLFLHKN